MSDTPKAGEVWVYTYRGKPAAEYTLVGTGDEFGNWHATTTGDRGVFNVCVHVGGLTRKPAAPPTDVECWTNYYPRVGHGSIAYSSAQQADINAEMHRTWRFDAYGNWVPCNGKTVLGPAVKAKP